MLSVATIPILTGRWLCFPCVTRILPYCLTMEKATQCLEIQGPCRSWYLSSTKFGHQWRSKSDEKVHEEKQGQNYWIWYILDVIIEDIYIFKWCDILADNFVLVSYLYLCLISIVGLADPAIRTWRLKFIAIALWFSYYPCIEDSMYSNRKLPDQFFRTLQIGTKVLIACVTWWSRHPGTVSKSQDCSVTSVEVLSQWPWREHILARHKLLTVPDIHMKSRAT